MTGEGQAKIRNIGGRQREARIIAKGFTKRSIQMRKNAEDNGHCSNKR